VQNTNINWKYIRTQVETAHSIVWNRSSQKTVLALLLSVTLQIVVVAQNLPTSSAGYECHYTAARAFTHSTAVIQVDELSDAGNTALKCETPLSQQLPDFDNEQGGWSVWAPPLCSFITCSTSYGRKCRVLIRMCVHTFLHQSCIFHPCKLVPQIHVSYFTRPRVYVWEKFISCRSYSLNSH